MESRLIPTCMFNCSLAPNRVQSVTFRLPTSENLSKYPASPSQPRKWSRKRPFCLSAVEVATTLRFGFQNCANFLTNISTSELPAKKSRVIITQKSFILNRDYSQISKSGPDLRDTRFRASAKQNSQPRVTPVRWIRTFSSPSTASAVTFKMSKSKSPPIRYQPQRCRDMSVVTWNARWLTAWCLEIESQSGCTIFSDAESWPNFTCF